MAEGGREVVENWIIEQTEFSEESINQHMESLFTQGNGYLGMRGDSQFSNHIHQKGTFINGFYESGPITYGEKAYGYAENWQTIIPLPEAKDLKIKINNRDIFSNHKGFTWRKRSLNLKESFSEWDFQWKDQEGREYGGIVKILIPFESTGIVLFQWNLVLPEDESQIVVESPLIFQVGGESHSDDPRLPGHFDGSSLSIVKEIRQNRGVLSIKTGGSRLHMSCTMAHMWEGVLVNSSRIEECRDGFIQKMEGKASKKISITKAVSYSYGHESQSQEIKEFVLKEVHKANQSTYTEHQNIQKKFMERFWKQSDVQIEGDREAQISLRYNLFQLLQSTGRDGKRSIAAKGLSGSGYEGHYFWDAETYILPVFIYTIPSIARSMLMYRISILKEAENRAEQMGHQGVLFPWRTINGEESSAYFPAGTAQYHINSDIALGLDKYLDVTGDLSILSEGGDRLLAGTARFWADLGTMVQGKGFCFNTVTGPDEYTALVDNNYYTNISARENLRVAAKWLKGYVSDDEIGDWIEKSEQVYLPSEGTVTPQDDSFLNKEAWDFEGTRDDQYPLLLHFHPLNIYRKKVLKQADVIMAQVLFPGEMTIEQKRLNFDYYEQLTTRDSSLSACAQGINAFWLGYDSLAWEYFNETLHTDRKDLHKNVLHGLHTASMGGSYLMVINGYLGLELIKGTLCLKPRLPEHLSNLSLNISLRKGFLHLDMNKDRIIYRAEDDDMHFFHIKEKIMLKRNKEISRPTVEVSQRNFTLFRPKR